MSSTLPAAGTNVTVYRANPIASVIEIHGELSGTSEHALIDAYAQAVAEGAQRVVLNFADLEYMNSSGIGLLVTLLARVTGNYKRFNERVGKQRGGKRGERTF